MSNLHAAGLGPAQRKPHSIDDHERLGDAAICWRCCPELLSTVIEDPADDADLERLIEGLRAL